MDSSVCLYSDRQPELDALVALYDAVGWSAYTQRPDRLQAAIQGSHVVVTAWVAQALVGLARTISDGVSIVYIQDILVHPDQQGKDVGQALVREIFRHYPDVRQKVLLTDDRPEQLRFYERLGFHNTRNLSQTPLNAFVIIEGATLS